MRDCRLSGLTLGRAVARRTSSAVAVAALVVSLVALIVAVASAIAGWRQAHAQRTTLAPNINATCNHFAVDQPGDVTVDIRLLQPDTGLATLDPGGQALSASDGTYSLALPGAGCFVVTIVFNTDTRRGQFTALAAPSPDAC